MKRSIAKISEYVLNLLASNSKFTGKLELNFKDGKLKDILETKRTKIEEERRRL